MSHTTRFNTRRPLVVTGLVVIGWATSAAIILKESPTPDRALLNRIPSATYRVLATGNESPIAIHGDRVTSAYFAEFTGVGAEGRDMVWRGAVAGVAVGELTVRLAHVSRDIDAAKPIWPVEGIIFVSGDDPQRAFAAEVHGTIDWMTKRVKLEGEVSTGYMRGSHLEQTADLINHDLSGEMRFAAASLAAR
ncbi:MAG: hypothetical protein ABI889_06400 [Gemmatimonadota bacterium]